MIKKIKKFNKSLIVFGVSLVFLFSVGLVLPVQAGVATLYLFPSTGNFTVGETFPVQVRVDTGKTAINAADGTLIFNPAKLEVKSISKENSIFNIWVQEPTFSNSVGTISFAGGKPSPGFTGAAGIIITITFKAKTASAAANLNFSSGSVLADDGKGTNILGTMATGVYTLKTREISPIPPEEYIPLPTPEQAPLAPLVSSKTHPDENKWYSNNDPEFSWKLPSDVTDVSLLLNQNPTANPGEISDGRIESKKFEDVEDGAWYFHIKFKNQLGWGEITHRKVLIDTKPPLPFEIKVQQENPTDPRPILIFDTTDEISGLDYYEIKIDQGEAFTVEKELVTIKPYQTSFLAPGKHRVEVKAIDKAGNNSLASTEIEVLPIETPIITKFPKYLTYDQNLILEGKSLPDVTIRIFIQDKRKEPVFYETEANEKGNWSFVSPITLEGGDYETWAQAENRKGALSLPSQKISFWVGLPPFLKFGKIVIDYLSIMITLVVLIIAAIAIIFYGRYRISLWRKRMRVETRELARAIYRAFRTLREEVQKQIEFLDGKKGLTEAEKKVRDKLKETLDFSEKFVRKEVRDIEKELE